jgi:hypothetical protein
MNRNQHIKCTCLLFISILLSSVNATAQKDSVHSIFQNPPHLGKLIRYSYLKWDFGYTGFNFSNTYLAGQSLDIIGAVFNDDLGLAMGIDGASAARGRFNAPTDVAQSYSAFYFKAEPMLNPNKLFNLSAPIKFSGSVLSYTNPYASNTGRRSRLINYGFAAFTFGLNGFVNVFKAFSMGVGASYRIALKTNSAVSLQDYDNFAFSVIFRLKWYTRKIGKGTRSGNDYYSPQLQYK